jgi:hypothetical protein
MAVRSEESVLAGWLLGSWVRIPLKAWMFVRVFLCCVVLCKYRPCDGLITHPRSPTICLNSSRNLLYVRRSRSFKDCRTGPPNCNSRATCCPRHSVMLPAETFEIRKRLLTLSLEKSAIELRINSTRLLENYERKLTTISIFPSDPIISPYCSRWFFAGTSVG